MNNFLNFTKILLSVIFIIATTFLNAQWSTDLSVNTPICNLTGKQNDPRIISDGSGGSYIAWKDKRTGVSDIYVQRVDINGNMLWVVNGVGACTDPADQSTPTIVKDMNGGLIVAWSDLRSGQERDIYAQRIDSSGNMVWAIDGVPVANKVKREHNEKIISDGSGGCIVAWEQEDTDSQQWDVWAQRLDNTGAPQWTRGGIPLSTVSSNKLNPKLQKDKFGGGFVTWQDFRNGNDYDIYAQHLDLNGNRLWGDSALSVCNEAGVQNNPKIDPDSLTGGIYIAWVDKRNILNGYDIYAQRIDSSGNMLWANNGVSVCSTTGNQSAIDILSTPEIDGVVVTWKDARNGNTDIYAQRISGAGLYRWALNGVSICTNPYPQRNPNITYDESGGAVIVWEDSSRVNKENISAQRIDSLGNLLWTINGITVSDNFAKQRGPKSISDKEGGVIVVWQDYRQGPRDIYAQRIYGNGLITSVNRDIPNLFNILIYPNPSTGIINVERPFKTKGLIKVSVLTAASKLVKSAIITEETSKVEIDVSDVSKGIYFVKIENKGLNSVSKLIKQ